MHKKTYRSVKLSILKKIAAFCFLSSITLTAFADQCPNSEDVVVYSGGRYIVSAPSGWDVISADNIYGLVHFSVAAWGDHTKDTDKVRCYYFMGGEAGRVELRSEQIYRESSVNAHTNWNGDYDSHYHLCSELDVRNCVFG